MFMWRSENVSDYRLRQMALYPFGRNYMGMSTEPTEDEVRAMVRELAERRELDLTPESFRESYYDYEGND